MVAPQRLYLRLAFTRVFVAFVGRETTPTVGAVDMPVGRERRVSLILRRSSPKSRPLMLFIARTVSLPPSSASGRHLDLEIPASGRRSSLTARLVKSRKGPRKRTRRATCSGSSEIVRVVPEARVPAMLMRTAGPGFVHIRDSLVESVDPGGERDGLTGVVSPALFL